MPTTTASVIAVLLAVALLFPAAARAEPYLAVQQGLKCSSCHSHPAGGGKRTAYGNAFAQSQMPASRIGDADSPLWTGEVSRWLAVGANVRADYRYTDVPGAEARSEFGVRRGTAYVEAQLIEDRLSLYVDQQFAPSSSLNREAYLRLDSRDGRFGLMAGQFFLPYGLRFQDDTVFVRQVTGANFTNPDRGVQVSYESGGWSTQFSLTNGSGGGAESDTGKQASLVAQYVGGRWRAGASVNVNDADAGDRRMQNVFAGFRTGPVAWLAELDLIRDDLPGGGVREAVAGYVAANWRFLDGNNLKVAYDYLDPDDDLDGEHDARWSLLWEYTPIQFLQLRIGARSYDGSPDNAFANRDEFLAEIHGFF